VLLQLDDEQAIVGVPNIFIRDEVAEVYRHQIEAALGILCGRPISMTVIIRPRGAKAEMWAR
jgi:chromosomal replication initiation ATPase DnaA